ncbi:MAG: BsaA family SipW-dependent biofilm matrix protein [Bacilli bacterium]|nr:BsaA family SipW-dependent biofilm matrix protein [Bacilli bacterium]
MEEMEKKKNKKPLIALLAVAVLGVVGGTFAFFTSTDTFSNIFSTKPYSMEVVETFESPTNWTPGTTTAKTVVATNKGDVDAAVRISYTETWKDASNNTLPLTDGTNRAAVINFASDLATKWIQSVEGGTTYYYYKTKLSKNQSSSSLIESVTFNPNVEIDVTNNCTTSGNTKTCTTQTAGYAGGTYTLTITVETVQFDQYKEAWGTDVTIN